MSDSNNDGQKVKRPYATLDLKATEIKVSPISERVTNVAGTMATSTAKGSTVSGDATQSAEGPKPAPASSYATFKASAYQTSSKAGASTSGAIPATDATAAAKAASAGSSYASTQPTKQPNVSGTTANPTGGTVDNRTEVIIKKRGGFFSHLAASIIGGAIALAGSQWAIPYLPQYGLDKYFPQLAATDNGFAQRIAKLESAQKAGDLSTELKNAEARIADLEKTAATITGISESQSRLVAETKAALAAAASDAGAPDQLERLTTVENKLKAMTEAGASDPNAGRLEQLAALTGKVADLETSLATQLTALRKSVAGDVEARVASTAEASEAAKSGTQRIDRELASLKTESAALTERLTSTRAEADRANAALKTAQEETAALRAALDSLKSSVAKPADVASAVAPVSEKLAALEAGMLAMNKAEEERRLNAERVVLTLELQNLKRALERGQKFDAELAEVQKVSGGKFDLAVLDRYKTQGVPTLADLSNEFRTAANAIIDADSEAADGSVVGRLIAGAKSVVRVRKVNHDANDKSPEAITGRMEGALKEARLAAILDEAQALPAKSKDAAQPFLDKVAARASVDKAVASLETQLKTSLSGQPAETRQQ